MRTTHLATLIPLVALAGCGSIEIPPSAFPSGFPVRSSVPAPSVAPSSLRAPSTVAPASTVPATSVPRSSAPGTSVPVSVAPKAPVAFDHCGPPQGYAKRAWYAKLVAAVTAQPFHRSTDSVMSFNPEALDELRAKRLTMADVTELCAALDGSIALVLVRGQYMGNGFHLFRFDVASGVLTEAWREDLDGGPGTPYSAFIQRNWAGQGQPPSLAPWFATPKEIGKRTGDEITLTGRDGDAGFGEENTFRYNVRTNRLRIVRSCLIEAGEGERIKKTCTDI